MKVGTASYGNQKKRFKIKDGENVYRILPPLGEMADTGRWFKHYKVVWGYQDSNKKNKPFLDCFKASYDDSGKMIGVDVPSAARDRAEEIKTARAAVADALKADPTNQELLAKKKTLGELGMKYNIESKYYINAVNEQNEIGLLKIGKRAMDGLMEQIKVLRERGLDPLGLNGVFFNFHRSGTGLSTVYTVTPHRVLNADGTESMKTHTMDDVFINRLSAEAFELADMYPAPTSEEVSRIVNEGATAVDEILGKSESSNTASNTNVNDVLASTAGLVNNTPAPAPVAETPVETPVQTPVAETPAAPVAETPTPAPAAEENPLANMSEEDFLKSLGV